MNRLATRFLFPGQTLVVPDKDALFLADTGGGDGGGKIINDASAVDKTSTNTQTNKQRILSHKDSGKGLYKSLI